MQQLLYTHVSSHEDGPQKNSKHESIVLEMYVIHDQEPWMKEERRRDDTLHGRISLCTHKTIQFS